MKLLTEWCFETLIIWLLAEFQVWTNRHMELTEKLGEEYKWYKNGKMSAQHESVLTEELTRLMISFPETTSFATNFKDILGDYTRTLRHRGEVVDTVGNEHWEEAQYGILLFTLHAVEQTIFLDPMEDQLRLMSKSNKKGSI